MNEPSFISTAVSFATIGVAKSNETMAERQCQEEEINKKLRSPTTELFLVKFASMDFKFDSLKNLLSSNPRNRDSFSRSQASSDVSGNPSETKRRKSDPGALRKEWKICKSDLDKSASRTTDKLVITKR